MKAVESTQSQYVQVGKLLLYLRIFNYLKKLYLSKFNLIVESNRQLEKSNLTF